VNWREWLSVRNVGIDPRAKSASCGASSEFLSFLVLVQGYTLLAEPLVTIAQALALGVLVGLGAGIGAYLLSRDSPRGRRIAKTSDCVS